MKPRNTKPPANFPDDHKPPSATVRVGPITFPVDRKVFEEWESALAAKTGFARDAMVAEIRSRLGL